MSEPEKNGNQKNQSTQKNEQNLIQIVFAGDSGGGKTSFAKRLAENIYDPNQKSTIGVEFYNISYPIPNSKRVLSIRLWDTAGQERFRSISTSYYRSADAIFFFLSVEDIASKIEKIQEWKDEIDAGLGNKNVVKMFILSKTDLYQTVVSIKHLSDIVKEDKYFDAYCEISSCTGDGIQEAYEKMMKLIITKRLPEKDKEFSEKDSEKSTDISSLEQAPPLTFGQRASAFKNRLTCSI